MRKFLVYFRIAVADALVYRASGFIWMLNDIGPALVALFFWLAVFKTHVAIGGYTVASIVFYYFGVMLINSLVATHPQHFLSDEIRSGAFSNYLVKPIHLAVFKIAGAISWRAVRVLFFLPAILILWWLFSSTLRGLSFSVLNLCLFAVSLLAAFLINFFIKMILGLTTIWFTEAGWLFNSFNIIAGLFGGELIPLDLLPQALLTVNNWLPFKYMLYFPLSLILNRVNQPSELIGGLLLGFFWTIFFYWLYRLVLKRGIKNYCAYGG